MNQREDILKEALKKIEEDSQRWQIYLKEHETAIENMDMFGKRLIVDVMVPVGKKAFMPGYLLHTNEVLVGHFQGYFSKCTTYKAKEICDFRIKMAKKFLKNLEVEADMWQNKLYKPYTEGAMPCGEEHEIIEEFNEEAEKLWMERHRIAVKQSKLKDREEREKNQNSKDLNTSKEKTENDILKMLEEAELLEELGEELDSLNVDEVNDETMRKLLSGEIKLPQERRRLAHVDTSTEFLTNVETQNDIKNSTNTNNNVQSNPLIMNLLSSEVEEVEEEPIPEIVSLVKEQAKYLNTEDQIGFYEYQIQIIRQKLHLLPLRTQEALNEKIHLLNILEHLEELLEETEEGLGEKELSEKGEENDGNGNVLKFTTDKGTHPEKEFEENDGSESSNKSKPKRRISFALQDQTLEFRNHEAVTQMMPPKIEKPRRDVIRLDDNNEEDKDKHKEKSDNILNKMELIRDKVEKNIQFMEENQSKQDFDLVQQIIQSPKSANTLHIKFKHSKQEGYKIKDISKTICAPADFYNLYAKSQESLENCNKTSTLFLNSYEGEEQVKAPALKETDRQISFINPKLQFSNPQSKSILKNKLVDKEIGKQLDTNNKLKKSKKQSSKREDDDCLSTYYKVMNDVVEKPLTEPEPLPDVKFIDAHTPKKRISRFKQMRQGNDTT